MTDARDCPTCRSPIPADAPGGACPRCLMALGYATDPGAPPPDVPAADVERRFPGYEVRALLGRGGMGVVFRARQKALDREVALKVLPGGPTRGAEFVQRFQREARALARLQHPGIVQIFDFGASDDGWCFLAMELVEGVNLRRVLADRRIAPKEALAIVPQICDALQYAHDQGVVHRDIKPENVLLTKDGKVKLADFGLAKLAGGGGAPALTASGHVMGTPHYMAPEQVERPGDVDHRADIYSLGVVFYEMLTGELPLGRFGPPSGKCDVDARIDDIVLRTLEKERSARFQHVSEVKTGIDAAGAAPPPIPAPPPRRGWRRMLYGEPPAADARISRLALASALLPIAVGAVPWLVWAATSGDEMIQRVPLTKTTASFAMLSGSIVAIVAWLRVRLSRGRLQHVALCWVGLVGSIVACTVVENSTTGTQDVHQQLLHERNPSVHPARAGHTYKPKPQPPSTVDGVEVPYGVNVGQYVYEPRVRALVQRLQAMHPGDVHSLSDFYGSDDYSTLMNMPEKDRDERAKKGLLGLPLAASEFFGGAGLDRYRVFTASFQADRGTVTLRDLDEGHDHAWIVAYVEKEKDSGGRWVFSIAPLEAGDIPEQYRKAK